MQHHSHIHCRSTRDLSPYQAKISLFIRKNQFFDILCELLCKSLYLLVCLEYVSFAASLHDMFLF